MRFDLTKRIEVFLRLVRGWHLSLLLVATLSILATGCITVETQGGPTAVPNQQAQPTAQAAAPAAATSAAGPANTNQVAPSEAKGSASDGQATDWIQRDMHATVKVWIVKDTDDKGNLPILGSCSGVLVDPSGVILTNWHCVGLRTVDKTDESGQGLRPGEMYNSQGIIVVGLTEDPKQAPQPTFLAKVRQGSPDLDIAVAKIYATLDGGRLPSSLPLTIVPLGDSNKVKVGDPIHLFGYPGIGGELITETSGQVSGFFKDVAARPDLQVDAIKTDAAMNHGNSGGLATNDRGEDIGIPTFGSLEKTGGASLGGVRMVNLAKPYIAKAMSDAFDPVPPRLPAGSQGTQATPPSQPAQPQAPQGTGKFSNAVFGTDVQGDKLVGQGTQFPTGTKKIVVQFDFSGMSTGAPWGYVLTIDGETAVDKRNANTWKDEATGQYLLTFGNGSKPLPDGKYELSLFIGGAAALNSTFAIGGGQSAHPPSSQGVAVKGKVVDADTGKGIAGGYFVLLKPGVTVKQFVDSKGSEDLMAAAGETDGSGNFRTDPPVKAGQKYGVVVIAKGYSLLGIDNALTVPANAAAELTLDQPVKLQKN